MPPARSNRPTMPSPNSLVRAQRIAERMRGATDLIAGECRDTAKQQLSD